jgi:hypothetical protein
MNRPEVPIAHGPETTKTMSSGAIPAHLMPSQTPPTVEPDVPKLWTAALHHLADHCRTLANDQPIASRRRNELIDHAKANRAAALHRKTTP